LYVGFSFTFSPHINTLLFVTTHLTDYKKMEAMKL
jgi:hypothetical protein